MNGKAKGPGSDMECPFSQRDLPYGQGKARRCQWTVGRHEQVHSFLLMKPGEELEQGLMASMIQSGEGFIKNEKVRGAGKGLRQSHALPFPAGQDSKWAVGQRQGIRLGQEGLSFPACSAGMWKAPA